MINVVTEQPFSTDDFDGAGTIAIDGWVFFLFLAAFVVAALYLARFFIRRKYSGNSYYDHAIYLIRLPKDKPGDEKKDFSVQQLREEISQGETIFNAIGGLRAQRGFKPWLFGRNDHYSFEIVARDKTISFYIAAPRAMARYVEQQVQAHFPDAVMEEVKDYNIFAKDTEALAGYVTTKRDYIFPIKTYNKMETDPLNSLVNVMSKIPANEGLAIQYIARSANRRWHNRVGSIVSKAIRTSSMSEALNSGLLHKFVAGVTEMFNSAKPNDPNTPPKRLTAMEEETLKGMESKNSKAGLDVNIRIVVSATNKIQAKIYLENMISAMSQYNLYEYGNSFNGVIPSYGQKKLIDDFIYRRYNRKIGFLLNTEEMNSLYHFPLKDAETPNILWLTARQAPAPTNMPDSGLFLGYNFYRGAKKDIFIKREDRRRHMHILGKSGGGKSQFIANMAVQDVLNGEGVCVIDPHGDLVEDVLCRVPPERADDVIIFSPHDLGRPLALNLIEFDSRYPEQKTFMINEMIGIFDKLYDLKSTGGPIFEQYMRNALLLIMSDPDSGSTLMEVPKVLSDAEFRKMKLERCSDPTVVDFWRKEAEKAGGDAALANIVPYITSKLTTFISNDMMRPIIGQQKSSFNFRDIMDNRKILLVDLPKGLVGELNAYLLGMIIVGKILMSALSRSDMPQEKRNDFYLYIDEFQNFTTNSICQILSEARKYGLSLTIAHQYIGQMVKNNDTTIKDAVFGNVGTTIAFKVGAEDGEVLEKEFSPVFNKFDLINIEAFTTYAKVLVDNSSSRPFSLHAPWPIAGTKREDLSKKIRTLSRLKYGRDKNIIEAEIMQRTRTQV